MKRSAQVLETAWRRLVPAFPGSEIRTNQEVDKLVSAIAEERKAKFRKTLAKSTFEYRTPYGRTATPILSESKDAVVAEGETAAAKKISSDGPVFDSPASTHIDSLLVGFDSFTKPLPNSNIEKARKLMYLNNSAVEARIHALQEDLKRGLATKDAAIRAIQKIAYKDSRIPEHQEQEERPHTNTAKLDQFCRVFRVLNSLGANEIREAVSGKSTVLYLGANIRQVPHAIQFIRFTCNELTELTFEEKSQFLARFLVAFVNADRVHATEAGQVEDLKDSIIRLLSLVKAWSTKQTEIRTTSMPYLESPDGKQAYIFNPATLFLARKLHALEAAKSEQSMDKKMVAAWEELFSKKNEMQKAQVWASFATALLENIPGTLSRYAASWVSELRRYLAGDQSEHPVPAGLAPQFVMESSLPAGKAHRK